MLRMEGYGGPVQPSPTIGQCLDGGLGWLEVECNRCKTRASFFTRRDPSLAGHAHLEARSVSQMPLMPARPLRATSAHYQAD